MNKRVSADVFTVATVRSRIGWLSNDFDLWRWIVSWVQEQRVEVIAELIVLVIRISSCLLDAKTLAWRSSRIPRRLGNFGTKSLVEPGAEKHFHRISTARTQSYGEINRYTGIGYIRLVSAFAELPNCSQIPSSHTFDPCNREKHSST